MPINVVRLRDMKLLRRDALEPEVIEDVTKYFHRTQRQNWEAFESSLVEIVESHTKYAILSHRWEKDELDYTKAKALPQNFLQRRFKSQGREKIRKFCEQASQYSCDYVWFDTGCIDKSSSSELEESIRSMFNWYRNSEICIVYLAGTKSMLDPHKKDDWFKRGWTLQELLAPPRMKFFNSDWTPTTSSQYDIDRTTTLTRRVPEFSVRLSAASGIYPVERLHNYVPGVEQAREVLHWASARQTTRPEDMAYCLIGLLNLELSVAYGEGYPTAFYRLQVEVMRRTEDRGLFFWSGSPSSHSSMLAATVFGFRQPVPWSDDGVRSDGYYSACLDRDPTITLTNCGIRMSIPLYSVELDPTTRNTSRKTTGGRTYSLVLWVPGLGCRANIQIWFHREVKASEIRQDWAIGLLGSAYITRKQHSTFLPILLTRGSESSSQRYVRLFTDRFLLEINIERDNPTLKEPEVIYIK
ncbi:hypothetical protein HGRIS_014808 [Hohenbuehelia grisea]|uniref:Heterokaryon incompatibility domain-containing protein n=1 Tax=Hohenbuehelia grisea TaxID=104357 RepID=A0ABR3IQT3_9AGAR